MFEAIGSKYLDPSGENNENRRNSDKGNKSVSQEKEGKGFKIEGEKVEEKKKKNCAC